MTPERIDQIADALDIVAPGCLCHSGTFDLQVLADRLFNCKSTVQLEITLIDELTTVGNVFGLTFRHNGDYCWFDKKTDENDK